MTATQIELSCDLILGRDPNDPNLATIQALNCFVYGVRNVPAVGAAVHAEVVGQSFDGTTDATGWVHFSPTTPPGFNGRAGTTTVKATATYNGQTIGVTR